MKTIEPLAKLVNRMTRPAKPLKLLTTYAAAFSSDGQALATVSKDVVVWNVGARTKRFRAHPLTNPSHATFSPAGDRIAVKSTAGEIAVLDAALGTSCKLIDPGTNGEGSNVHFSTCGRYLIDGSWSGHLTVRAADTGARIFEQRFPEEMIADIAHGPGAEQWYVLHSPKATDPDQPPPNGYVTVWSWPFERPRNTIPLPSPFVQAIAPSPDGESIAFVVAGGAQAIFVIAARDGRVIEQAAVGYTRSVSWAPNGRELASSEDAQVVFRAFPGLTPIASTKLQYPSTVEYSPDGALVALGSWESGVLMPRAEITQLA